MGMAFYKLFADSVCDIGKIKNTFFLFHCSMENHLQKNITELLFQKLRILLIDSLYNFIGFFNKILFDCFVILLSIPRTTAGSSENTHNREQVFYIILIFYRIVNSHFKFSVPFFAFFDSYRTILTYQVIFFKYFTNFFSLGKHFYVVTDN